MIMMNRTTILLAFYMVLVAPLSLAAQGNERCAQFLRQGIVAKLQRLADVSSPIIIRRNLCAESYSPEKTRKRFALFQNKYTVSRSKLKTLRKLVCPGGVSARKAKSLFRKLKRFIPKTFKRSFATCRKIERDDGQVDVQFGTLQSLDYFTVDIDAGNSGMLSGVSSSPSGAFACSSTVVPETEATTFTASPNLISCRRKASSVVSQATVSIQTTNGTIGIDFPSGTLSGDRLGFSFDEVEAMQFLPFAPLISGCTPQQDDLLVYECTTLSSYQDCLTELIAGNLKDCRAEIPVEFNPDFPSSVYRAERGDASIAVTSNIVMTVSQASPGTGSYTGTAGYTFSMAVPNRDPAQNCDPNCPLNVCGANPCNRDCSRADGRTDHETGSAGGLFSLFVVNGQSCTENVTASEIVPDTIDLYRAYQKCEREGLWGNTTEIEILRKAGKVFMFNNPVTTHTVTPNFNEWTFTNIAELVYPYIKVSLPVEVNCN
jgi:hypothetical protein